MNGDDFAVWGIALIVMLGVTLRPIVRGWGKRLEAQADTGDLRRELDEMRERFAELEGVRAHVQELEDRVEFAERMLAQRRDQAELPAHRTPV